MHKIYPTHKGFAPIPLNKGGDRVSEGGGCFSSQKGMGVVLWVIIAAVVLGGGYAAYRNYQQPTTDNRQRAETSMDTQDWKTYRNEKYGFEFKYPSSITLSEQKGNEWLVVRLVGLDYELYLQTGSKQSPLPDVSLLSKKDISLAGYVFQEGIALPRDNPRLGLEKGKQWIQFTGVPVLNVFGWLQESRQEGITEEIHLLLDTIHL